MSENIEIEIKEIEDDDDEKEKVLHIYRGDENIEIDFKEDKIENRIEKITYFRIGRSITRQELPHINPIKSSVEVTYEAEQIEYTIHNSFLNSTYTITARDNWVASFLMPFEKFVMHYMEQIKNNKLTDDEGKELFIGIKTIIEQNFDNDIGFITGIYQEMVKNE